MWHSGTLSLRAERQSARMSHIKNGRLGFYGAEQLKCNRVMTLGFKWIRAGRRTGSTVVVRHKSCTLI